MSSGASASYAIPAGVMTTRPSSPRALTLPWVPRTRPAFRIARPAATRSRFRSASDGTGDRLLVRGLQHAFLGDDRRHELVWRHVEGHVHRGGTRRCDAHTEDARDLVAAALLDLDL